MVSPAAASAAAGEEAGKSMQQKIDRSVTDIEDINALITDRSDCFYWQTDRAIDPSVAGGIFAKRHELITDDELTTIVRNTVDEKFQLISRKDEDQNNLGNVNAVRAGSIGSRKVIIRVHPKGLENGYFWAEKMAAGIAANHGLPSYQTLVVQDIDAQHPFAFMVIEKLPGQAISKFLELNSEKTDGLTREAGRMMGRLHQIPVDGFGFFDNQKAKQGLLQGKKTTYKDHVLAGLDFNLRVMVEFKFISDKEKEVIRNFFHVSSLSAISQATIVHNDFADWNLLTDGEKVTGILDWDESHAGDPIADFGCWTTFYDMQRFKVFLQGYQEVATLPKDFESKLWYYRLRYLISKLTLRARRLSWDFGPVRPMLEKKVATGRQDLEEAMKKLNII